MCIPGFTAYDIQMLALLLLHGRTRVRYTLCRRVGGPVGVGAGGASRDGVRKLQQA
jgi:hypothetical protein